MALSTAQLFSTTVFIIGVGTLVLLASAAFIGYAAARVEPQGISRPTGAVVFGLLLLVGLWFGAALAASVQGFIALQMVELFALFPILLGGALTYTAPVKRLLREIPTPWLIAINAYRMAGLVFIFPYMVEGVLTQGFALPAGSGDFITGLLAVPIAILVARRGRSARWPFLAWSAFGILDLLVAASMAARFGFAVDVAPFPVTSIPLFFGPALGIFMHMITIRNFNLRHK